MTPGPLAWLMRQVQRSPERATAAVLPLEGVTGPVYAVGDVHGCWKLYREAEARIIAHADSLGAPATIVLLGDIVDRGIESAMMLDHLLKRPPENVRRLCLMGNHEELMLRFLQDPGSALNWLDFGGYETLASYGIGMGLDELRALSPRKLSQVVAAVIPDSHRKFLAQLPLGLQHGRYVLAHAGLDGAFNLSEQPRDALLWGRCEGPVPDGLTLVHGHVIHPEPLFGPNSIGVDTGAYATGKLTTVCLLQGRQPSFLTVDKAQPTRR